MEVPADFEDSCPQYRNNPEKPHSDAIKGFRNAETPIRKGCWALFNQLPNREAGPALSFALQTEQAVVQSSKMFVAVCLWLEAVGSGHFPVWLKNPRGGPVGNIYFKLTVIITRPVEPKQKSKGFLLAFYSTAGQGKKYLYACTVPANCWLSSELKDTVTTRHHATMFQTARHFCTERQGKSQTSTPKMSDQHPHFLLFP